MTNIPESPKIGFIDDPHAPEVFADGCVGIFLRNGNLSLTFASARADHLTNPSPVNNVVVGRLILPLPAAENLVEFVGNYLKQQKAGSAPPSQTLQ